MKSLAEIAISIVDRRRIVVKYSNIDPRLTNVEVQADSDFEMTFNRSVRCFDYEGIGFSEGNGELDYYSDNENELEEIFNDIVNCIRRVKSKINYYMPKMYFYSNNIGILDKRYIKISKMAEVEYFNSDEFYSDTGSKIDNLSIKDGVLYIDGKAIVENEYIDITNLEHSIYGVYCTGERISIKSTIKIDKHSRNDIEIKIIEEE